MLLRRSAPALSTPSRPSRRDEILQQACRLFAEHGFANVTVDDVGASCGISGPAIYHHFASKEAMLGEMLVSISRYLLDRGRTIVDIGADPDTTLRALIAAHAEFASSNPELIAVQYRDLLYAPEEEQRVVRRLQRQYLELWVDTLTSHEKTDVRENRSTVHATFGLLNSTPYAGSPTNRSATLLTKLACRAVGIEDA